MQIFSLHNKQEQVVYQEAQEGFHYEESPNQTYENAIYVLITFCCSLLLPPHISKNGYDMVREVGMTKNYQNINYVPVPVERGQARSYCSTPRYIHDDKTNIVESAEINVTPVDI